MKYLLLLLIFFTFSCNQAPLSTTKIKKVNIYTDRYYPPEMVVEVTEKRLDSIRVKVDDKLINKNEEKPFFTYDSISSKLIIKSDSGTTYSVYLFLKDS